MASMVMLTAISAISASIEAAGDHERAQGSVDTSAALTRFAAIFAQALRGWEFQTDRLLLRKVPIAYLHGRSLAGLEPIDRSRAQGVELIARAA